MPDAFDDNGFGDDDGLDGDGAGQELAVVPVSTAEFESMLESQLFKPVDYEDLFDRCWSAPGETLKCGGASDELVRPPDPYSIPAERAWIQDVNEDALRNAVDSVIEKTAEIALKLLGLAEWPAQLLDGIETSPLADQPIGPPLSSEEMARGSPPGFQIRNNWNYLP